jgi:hypothetical protein
LRGLREAAEGGDQVTLSALPRLTRLRIGPAEQAAGEFLEAHGFDLAAYHVEEWVRLAEAIMEVEAELAAYDEGRAKP